MRNNDTITCAVTTSGCRQPKQTASVFRAVGAGGWDHDCCDNNATRGRARNTGCCESALCTNNRNTVCCENTSCANNRNTGCCESAPCANTRNTGCCENTPCDRNHNKGCKESTYRTAAMVYEEEHELDLFCEEEEAIRKGTLFSELYMPMNGEWADPCGAQLCDGQAEAFAAWELRLYLNTHPHDRKALQMFRSYCCRCGLSYASAFACDDGESHDWNWTDAPWPWEFNCSCE